MPDDLATIRSRAAEHERDIESRLSVNDVARRFQLSPTTIRDIPRTELPYIEMGQGQKLKRRRYRLADVDAFEQRLYESQNPSHAKPHSSSRASSRANRKSA